MLKVPVISVAVARPCAMVSQAYAYNDRSPPIGKLSLVLSAVTFLIIASA
jgi:hypothetical protein